MSRVSRITRFALAATIIYAEIAQQDRIRLCWRDQPRVVLVVWNYMGHTINQAMLDSSKKARLAVQDLSKVLLPLPTYSSLPKPSPKKSLLCTLKSSRWEEGRMSSSKGLSPFHPQGIPSPTKNFHFLPPQNIDSSSLEDNDNPQEYLQTYLSVRAGGKNGPRRLQRNISERYQQRMQVLREWRPPIVSQQLLTIAQFTDQALTSIPKHVEIFNQKLRLLKKSMTPACDVPHRKKEPDLNPMPLQLKTLRVVRKNSAQKGTVQASRKSLCKFRMYLRKKTKKREEVFKIEGWDEEKTDKERHFYGE